MVKDVYLNLANTINKYPREPKIGNTLRTKIITKEFANGIKQYAVSGEATKVKKNKLQLQLIEEFFNKCKNGHIFEELPFFKKITETKPEYADRLLVITRANGKGLSTKTTVNSEGIRMFKVTKRLNKEGTQYDCVRYSYNDKGTEPIVFSTWTENV